MPLPHKSLLTLDARCSLVRGVIGEISPSKWWRGMKQGEVKSGSKSQFELAGRYFYFSFYWYSAVRSGAGEV